MPRGWRYNGGAPAVSADNYRRPSDEDRLDLHHNDDDGYLDRHDELDPIEMTAVDPGGYC